MIELAWKHPLSSDESFLWKRYCDAATRYATYPCSLRARAATRAYEDFRKVYTGKESA